MKKINILFLVIFLLLGLVTFFSMNNSKNKGEGTVPASESGKAKKAEEKSKFNYRGYEIDILARFGKQDKSTGQRYIIGTPEKSLQMFNVLTHGWKEVAIEQKNNLDVSRDISRINEEWNCHAYYRDESEDTFLWYNSVITFSLLNKEKGFKGDFNTAQGIRFYYSQDDYEKAARHEVRR